MATRDPNRALTFGSFAEEYALWRPTYPAEAVEWLVPEHASHVADVGAGTGKLTGALLDRGLTVDAVEPDPQMLRVLHRLYPSAAAHKAPAEALPLADASVDAVVVADAWHWLDQEQAVEEVRRVLHPDGWLGLVWNLVKPVKGWEFELAGIDPDHKGLHGHGDDSDEELGASFRQEEIETATFPWIWEMTPEHWRAYLATNSAVAAMGEAERRQRLDQSQAIATRVCQETGRAAVPLHHEEYCLRWQPR
jgi:ubiquinone/menaquinone biosynthesis C-methylase UbiE